MNESINDEAVSRTAPATPGLLNTVERKQFICLKIVMLKKLPPSNSSQLILDVILSKPIVAKPSDHQNYIC